MEHCQVNDENVFDQSFGNGDRGKGTNSSNDSRSQNINKNPLKPLNDASRLSGNMKDLTQDKTPRSSPYAHIRQPDSAERWIERNHVVIKEHHLSNAGNILKDLVGSLPINDIENTWVQKAGENIDLPNTCTDATSAQSDIDELSDLLGGLDITPTISHETQAPLDTESSNDDGKIQFGRQVTISSDPKCHSNEDDYDDEEISFRSKAPRQVLISEDENVMQQSESAIVMPSDTQDPTSILTSHGTEDSPVHVGDKEGDPLLSDETNSPSQIELEITKSKTKDVNGSVESSKITGDSISSVSDVSNIQSMNKEVSVGYVVDLKGDDASDKNDPSTTNGMVSNSPTKILTEDGDISSTYSEIDPFSTKSKIVNSPARNENTDCSDKYFESENPFSTKSKIVNSPARDTTFFAKSGIITEDSVTNDIDMFLQSEDPFPTKSKITNSPSKDQGVDPIVTFLETENPISEGANCMDKVFETEDPFSTKCKVVNSPAREGGEESMANDADTFLETEDQFSTKSKIVYSPAKDEKEHSKCKDEDCADVFLPNEDPFSTKSKIGNFPGKIERKDPIAKRADCADAFLETEDPFSTNSKVANSPTRDQREDPSTKDAFLQIDDPFSTNSKVADSPAKDQSEDPTTKDAFLQIDDQISSNIQIVRSPEKDQSVDSMANDTDCTDAMLETEDPFSTKNKIINSPAEIENVDLLAKNADTFLETKDLFSTMNKMANSPVKEQSEDPMSKDTDCADAILQIEDPFSSSNKVANSPAKDQSESPMTEADAFLETTDPFSTNSKIVNSPTKDADTMLETEDPFSTNSKIVNSPTKDADTMLETEDPFSTNSMIIDSPAKIGSDGPVTKGVECADAFLQIEDPLLTNRKIVNSPSKIESENPLAKDAATILHTEDPFYTKSKIVNSPAQYQSKDPMTKDVGVFLDTEDTFSSKSMIGSSPVKNENEDPVITDAEFSNQFLETEDPFSTKSNIVNSPSKNACEDDFPNKSLDENPFQSKSTVGNSPLKELNSATETDTKMQTDGIESSDEDDDDFQSKSKVGNSPLKELNSATETDTTMQTDGIESSDEDDDDFQSLENSPIKVREEEDLWSIKSPLIDSPCVKTVASDLFQAKGNGIEFSDDKGPQGDVDSSSIVEQPSRIVKDTQNASLDIDDLVMAMKSNSLRKNKRTTDDLIQQINETCGPVDRELEVSNHSENFTQEQGNMETIKIDNSDGDHLNTDEEKVNIPPKEYEGCNDDFEFVKPKLMELKSKQAIMTGPGVGDRQSNALTSSEPITDDFDDAMFEDASEALHSTRIADRLERDFGSQEMALNLNRGSVLLKFDPLAEKRGSPRRPPRVSEIFKGSSVPSDDGVCLFGTPPKKATRRPVNLRVPGIAKESIEEEMPAHEVDMMLNLEAHETIIGPADNTFAPPGLIDLGVVYSEADYKKMKMNLTLHYEERLLQKDRDYDKQRQENDEEHAKAVAELEGQISALVEEKEKLSTKVDSFKAKSHRFKTLFEDYAQLITKLSNENKMLNFKVDGLTKYSTQAIEDYKTMDKSFDDLFHRYEKMKSMLDHNAENEAALKKSLEQSHEKYKEKVEAMKNMKEKAESKLSEQEEQIEKLNSSNKADAAKLEAVLKRKEMEIRSLKDSLERKKAENAELTELCDSLINNVSGK